jgi:hypothetical protein
MAFTARANICSLVLPNFFSMCKSEVAKNMCILGFLAYFKASQHAFISFSEALHNPAIEDVLICCDIVFTASKSPHG